MRALNPLFMADGYKYSHKPQYPAGTTLVYTNFTPRKSRVPNVDYMYFFGLQYILEEYLQNRFEGQFFQMDKKLVIGEAKHVLNKYFNGEYDTSHFEALHDLGYLPIKIQALPEGSKVPLNVPCMVMWNTHPDFFWLPNFLETMISNIIWKPCTSATSASVFRRTFDKFASFSGANSDMVDFQGHDFSYRGMSGLEDAALSGAAHLLFFKGTDTVPALELLGDHYLADTSNIIGCSVPATEHSVMCAGGQEGELETIRRLLKIYPEGILSVVSDTWDLFKLVNEYLPALKQEIVERPGTLVIRPDSGIPHLIINGDPHSDCELEKKGVVRLLDETFGHTRNGAGFKRLNHVGTIYGDGINFDEQRRILDGLVQNGYESTTTVIGMGSYTYQYVTRDTFGTVCKATYCEVNGEGRPIFKSPKTGAWKKSHKGLLRVGEDKTGLYVEENVPWSREGGLMEPVFENGRILRKQSLEDIRDRVKQ